MTTRFERKWWVMAPTVLLAVFATQYLMRHAGLEQPYNAAQWVLYVLCAGTLQRVLSFAAWLLALAVSPVEKVAQRLR